jgi:motility quorum-sensing regulator / GCU-specific mRNA interferase toxin
VEKRTPHCKLSFVKTLAASGKIRTTQQARQGAGNLGMTFSDMVHVVMCLQPTDFYKSMTTNLDSKIWQDVYRPSTQAGLIYLKLTVMEDVLIVSFKEL